MNSKGFTIIEMLIVAVIVGILIFMAITAIKALNGGNYCDMYRYAPISDVPASCWDYFSNEGASK